MTHRAWLAAVLVSLAALGGLAGGDSGTGGRITGVVLRGSGEVPDEGRTVTLVAEGAEPRAATADAWGRFTFEDVPPGRAHELRIVAAKIAPVQVPGIELVPGETREVGDLHVGPAKHVTVLVLDERGQPLSGADLWRATPDADGRFVLKGLSEGEWYVQAFVEEDRWIKETESFGAIKVDARDVVLKLPK